MAVSKYGIMGVYSGKIGPIYGAIYGDKTITKARPHITKPRTEKQKANAQRMQVISPFLNRVKLYISVGFALSAIKNGNQAMQSAKSYNLKNAVKGEYPDQEIDYAEVRLTEGELQGPLNPTVQTEDQGFLFSWDYNRLDSEGSQFDRTMLMAYFPENKFFFQRIGGAERSKKEELLEVIPEMKGQEAEIYISFITDDRKQISNSLYMGRLVF